MTAVGTEADVLVERLTRRRVAIEVPDASATSAEIWPIPEPLPQGLPPVPKLDPLLLPQALRGWVLDIAERVQCALEYPAIGAMVALSAVVGRQVGIRPRQRDDWLVVPNLWGAIVGRPGLLKSPALAETLKPLHRLEANARGAFERAAVEAKARDMLASAERKRAEQGIQQALKSGDRKTAADLALGAAAMTESQPVRRRYITNDATVEKLGELMAENPRGLLVFRDELVGWLSGLDREGREGTRSFYLEAWNGGGRFTYDRIGRGTIEIEAACISLLGGIQPGPLAAYLRDAIDGGAGDDGLLQRLQMLVWPDAPADFREVDRWPDSEARRAAFETYERLDVIDTAAIGAELEPGGIPYLRLAGAAYEAFSDWRIDLEARLRRGDEHPAFEAALAKHRSLVPSLALLIHVADSREGGPVGEVPMVQAIAWAQFLEAHARRLYSPALDPALHAARELDRRIRAGDVGSPFQARDVYRRGWRLLDRLGTTDAIEYLADLGRVRAEDMDAGALGGRPTVRWHAHPSLLRRPKA
jgi:putative DNA primase/helicase